MGRVNPYLFIRLDYHALVPFSYDAAFTLRRSPIFARNPAVG
jgi:hypothetical protein